MKDLDPSAPSPDDKFTDQEFEAARQRANYGDGPHQDFDADIERRSPGADAAPPPVMPITIAKAEAYLSSCKTCHPRVGYRLGAKAPFLHAVPGTDFTEIDCSGFVRELIRESTAPMVAFPDGSVVQHDWVRAHRYRPTTIEAAKSRDGRVRIAFLSPSDTQHHIGHVVLIFDAATLESHSVVGPDSRPWTGDDWQALATVYELT